ncbi:MAG: FAD-binding oxidoreductase [Oscillospiraceae bacterium]
MSDFNFHVSPFGLVDMLKFKNNSNRRRKRFQSAPCLPVDRSFSANALADILHPAVQHTVIKEVVDETQNIKTYRLATRDGAPLANFRAGQYIYAHVEIGSTHTSRPYSICSSPALSERGEYQISVENFDESFVANYIHENWNVGVAVDISGPQGSFYYEPLRDTGHIVCLSGGSGITPFMSLARAVDDGIEDFDITILFGNGSYCDIPFHTELEQICKHGRVSVINVLSNEHREGCEYGYINRELIKKYAVDGGFKSIYVCGPPAMYAFVDKELEALAIPRKYIRHSEYAPPHDLSADPAYSGDIQSVYKLTVFRRDIEQTLVCRADETLLVALERGGIKAPSNCRSGECGFCRSRLVSGNVYVPPTLTAIRAADAKFSFIHPCYTFPLSDVAIEIWD